MGAYSVHSANLTDNELMSNRPWICPSCGEPCTTEHCRKCFAQRPFDVAPYNSAGSYMSTAYGPGTFIDGHEKPTKRISLMTALLVIAALWIVASITRSVIIRILEQPTLIENPAGPSMPTAPQ